MAMGRAADGPPRGDESLVGVLAALPEGRVKSFEHIRYSSELIYATALLDTFLSDSTLFLLLLHPKAIGKNSTVPLELLLASTSRFAVITEAAKRKVRELAYAGYTARLAALRTSFGIQVVVEDFVVTTLERYAELRNVVVHDQAFYDLVLSESGLRAVERTQQAPVTNDDVNMALETYRYVVAAVAQAIFYEVLHAVNDRVATACLSALQP
jgi:hypothetical protein